MIAVVTAGRADMGTGKKVWAKEYDGHGGVCVTDQDGQQVGFVSPGPKQAENAALVFAAPDLLAACEAWVAYFDRLMRDDEPGDPVAQARNYYHRARLEQTRAAVAKAKGGAA